jgi:hypothetical protein
MPRAIQSEFALSKSMNEEEFATQFAGLVERTRSYCLWFADPAAVPDSLEARLELLSWIERRGTRDDFVLARRLKSWLWRRSSATSVVS